MGNSMTSNKVTDRDIQADSSTCNGYFIDITSQSGYMLWHNDGVRWKGALSET